MTQMADLLAEGRWFQNGLGVGDSGLLDRDLPIGTWVVPAEVRLRGDWLHYRWATRDRGPSRPQTAPGVLDGLLAATDEPDGEAVLDFARRWGVIEACPHGLPSSHHPARTSRTGPTCTRIPVRQDRTGMIDWMKEPLSAWQNLGQRARAALTVAASVHDQKPAPWRTWSDAAWDLPQSSGSETRFIAATERPALAAAVDTWLAIGGVGVEFVWSEDRPVLSLRPRSLVGALALQLAYSTSRVDGLRLCFDCGRPYTPDRRPAPKRRSFCQECGLRAAQRQASRSYRQRKKDSEKEYTNG